MKIELLNDDYAASFILHVLAMETDKKGIKKNFLGFKTAAYDVIVKSSRGLVDDCATYTFHAYKPWTMTIAPPFLTLTALKEIGKEIMSAGLEQLSPAYAMGKALSTPFSFQKEVGKIFKNAQKLGGQLQLQAAELMKNKDDKINVMNQSCASRLEYAGAAKFEAETDPKCIIISLDYKPKKSGERIVDRYEGKDYNLNSAHLFRDMDKTTYLFWPGTGLFEKLS